MRREGWVFFLHCRIRTSARGVGTSRCTRWCLPGGWRLPMGGGAQDGENGKGRKAAKRGNARGHGAPKVVDPIVSLTCAIMTDACESNLCGTPCAYASVESATGA